MDDAMRGGSSTIPGPDVSICIATYRRPAGLERLLASLARMKLPAGLRTETIVVDNDAQQTASAVVRQFAANDSSLRYLVEPEQNIACARNRGVEAAAGHWIAFIDDDEVADEHWLDAFWSLLGRRQCDGAFGPVVPRLESVGTRWLPFERFYSRPRQATGHPVGRDAMRTGNAIVRRATLGPNRFDPRYGRTGGSDGVLFSALDAAGARFLWCDEARVSEFIPAARHRPGWLARRAFRGGFVHQQLAGARATAAVRSTCALLLFTGLTPLAAAAGRPAALQMALRACTQAGRLWAACGGKFTEYDGAAD